MSPLIIGLVAVSADPARRLERPAQDRRRSAARRPRSGCSRRRSSSCPLGVAGVVAGWATAAPLEGVAARARLGRRSRPPTSSCCRPPTGAATCRSSTRSPAGRRRSLAVVDRGRVSRRAARRGRLDRGRAAARRLPAGSSDRGRSCRRGGGRAGVRPVDPFALATGVTIADLHRHRPGRDAAHRPGPVRGDPVGDDAASCWWSGSRSWPAAGSSRGGREQIRRAAVGGMLTLAAYLCILVALSVAPLSGVAPLRESATVFAAAWGSVRLGEAAEPRRGHPPGRGVGADRRRGAAAGGRVVAGVAARLGRGRRPPASIGGTRPKTRRRPNRLLTSATPRDDQAPSRR